MSHEFLLLQKKLFKSYKPKKYKLTEALNEIINQFVGMEKKVLIRAIDKIRANLDAHYAVAHVKVERDVKRLENVVRRLKLKVDSHSTVHWREAHH